MTSIVQSDSNLSIKKSVSFPENVVSATFDFEKNDEELKGLLFYSQADFRRFKAEQRKTKARNQRMACRSACRSRRRGLMYNQYDTYMPGSVESRVHRLNRMLGMNEPLPERQAF